MVIRNIARKLAVGRPGFNFNIDDLIAAGRAEMIAAVDAPVVEFPLDKRIARNSTRAMRQWMKRQVREQNFVTGGGSGASPGARTRDEDAETRPGGREHRHERTPRAAMRVLKARMSSGGANMPRSGMILTSGAMPPRRLKSPAKPLSWRGYAGLHRRRRRPRPWCGHICSGFMVGKLL